MLSFHLYFDIRHNVDGTFVSCTRWLNFNPKKSFGTHLSQRLSRSQNHSATESIKSIKNLKDRDLPACSAVLQATAPLRTPEKKSTATKQDVR